MIRLGPPLRVKLSAWSVERRRVDRLGEDDVDGVHGRVAEAWDSPAPTLTTTGTSVPVAQDVDREPVPTSPKKSLMPAALTVSV